MSRKNFNRFNSTLLEIPGAQSQISHIGQPHAPKQYTYQPPEDKRVSLVHDLGYGDYYQQSSDQSEDQFDVSAVKSGYSNPTALQTEHLSAFDLIADKLVGKKLSQVISFGQEIIDSQSTMALEESSCFQLPQRHATTEAQIDHWLHQLSGNAPLSVLVNSIPHGIKGDRLLEMVYERMIPLTRAVWLFKIWGANEMGSLFESVQGHMDYNASWTEIVLKFLDRRIKELSNYEKDSDRRRNLVLRWKYCISLVKIQYDQGIIYQRKLLPRLTEMFNQLQAESCYIMTPLICCFIKDYIRSRNLMRQLLHSIVQKLKKLSQHGQITILQKQYECLLYLMRYCFVLSPQKMVSLKLWPEILPFKDHIFSKDSNLIAPVDATTLSLLETIENRNKQTTQDIGDLQMLENLWHTLGQFKFDCDFDETLKAIIGFFDLGETVMLMNLFEWMLENKNSKCYRTHCTAQILSFWLQSSEPIVEKQEWLFKFIERHKDFKISFYDLLELLRLLERTGDFSYFKYLQRLIVLNCFQTPDSIHSQVSKHFPTCYLEQHHQSQRHMFVQPIEINSQHLQQLTMDHLQESKESLQTDSEHLMQSLQVLNNLLKELSPYSRRDYFYWLEHHIYSQVPRLKDWKSGANPRDSLFDCRQWSMIVSLFETHLYHDCLLDLVFWLIKHTSDKQVHRIIVGVLKRSRLIFHSMGQTKNIFDCVYDHYYEQRKDGGHIDPLYLSFLESFQVTSSEAQAQIEKDRGLLKKKTGSSSKDVPNEFKDLRDLQDPSAVSSAVSSLAWKYTGKLAMKRIFQYALKILEPGNIVPLQQVLVGLHERNGLMSQAIIEHLKELSGSNDTGSGLFKPPFQDGWHNHFVFLVHLLAQGCLSPERFLKDFMYPICAKTPDHCTNLLRNTILLLRILLLQEIPLLLQLGLSIDLSLHLSALLPDLESESNLGLLLTILRTLAIGSEYLPACPLKDEMSHFLQLALESDGWFGSMKMVYQDWIPADFRKVYQSAKKSFSDKQKIQRMSYQSGYIVLRWLYSDLLVPLQSAEDYSTVFTNVVEHYVPTKRMAVFTTTLLDIFHLAAFESQGAPVWIEPCKLFGQLILNKILLPQIPRHLGIIKHLPNEIVKHLMRYFRDLLSVSLNQSTLLMLEPQSIQNLAVLAKSILNSIQQREESGHSQDLTYYYGEALAIQRRAHDILEWTHSQTVVWNEMLQNNASYLDAALATSEPEALESATKIKLEHMHRVIQVGLDAINCFRPIVFKSHPKDPTDVHIAQLLIQLVQQPFIYSFPIFDAVLDTLSLCLDHFTKDCNKQFINWCSEHAALLQSTDVVQDRIQDVLPFQDYNKLVAGLYTAVDTKNKEATPFPVHQRHFEPWKWLDVPYNTRTQPIQPNDTPVSLSFFGAQKVHVSSGSYYQRLHASGLYNPAPEVSFVSQVQELQKRPAEEEIVHKRKHPRTSTQ
ncbi:hypothetical protein EDD86DRAFT_264460 [Gorgonomyces haynaldii]|nr:hypothetical protein EDD86DRAFT_264460 [Gorgonomyces haynaldii]